MKRMSLFLLLSMVVSLYSAGITEYFQAKYERNQAKINEMVLSKRLLRSIETDSSKIELQAYTNRPFYYQTYNLGSAKTISTQKLWSGGVLGLNLNGQTETFGVWDGGGVRTTHQEFGGRVTQVDTPTGLLSHSTHVAGTLIASGIDANAKGMANQANLRAYDWNDDFTEMANAASSYLKVSNHSYGYIEGWYYNYKNDSKWVWFGDPSVSASEDHYYGFYSEQAHELDSLCYSFPNYCVVWAAGNDRGGGPASQPVEHWIWQNEAWVLSTQVREKNGGADGYDCLSHAALSKNVLAIGNVSNIANGYSQPSDVVVWSSSSWGPTDDGRIKPDLVAKGVSVYSTTSTNNTSYGSSTGTSMAAPGAAGTIALLQQHFNNLFLTYPRASTVKAILIHTADEAGTSIGPDYKFGWGLINAAQAVSLMTNYQANTPGYQIKEAILSNGQTHTYRITAGAAPIRITLCWTDLPGNIPAAGLNQDIPALVNDLDLRLESQTKTIYYPYVLNRNNPGLAATTGDNSRDNTEQIYQTTLTPGVEYIISISHKNTLSSSQTYSMVVTGFTEMATLPVEMTAFTANWNNSVAELQWTLASAFNLSGFNVYRNISPDFASAIKINTSFVPAENTSQETNYAYLDAEADKQIDNYYWVESVNQDGSSSCTEAIKLSGLPETDSESPDTPISSASIYPNPFSEYCSIKTTGASIVQDISVYNCKGQLVRSFVNPSATMNWDGRDVQGNECRSGVYYFQIKTGEKVQIVKGLLVK